MPRIVPTIAASPLRPPLRVSLRQFSVSGLPVFVTSIRRFCYKTGFSCASCITDLLDWVHRFKASGSSFTSSGSTLARFRQGSRLGGNLQLTGQPCDFRLDGFRGACCYSDDIVLASPTRYALSAMVNPRIDHRPPDPAQPCEDQVHVHWPLYSTSFVELILCV